MTNRKQDVGDERGTPPSVSDERNRRPEASGVAGVPALVADDPLNEGPLLSTVLTYSNIAKWMAHFGHNPDDCALSDVMLAVRKAVRHAAMAPPPPPSGTNGGTAP